MIVPMLKYSFLVFHTEYLSFLKELQELGVVHVAQKEVQYSAELEQKYAQLTACENTILFLSKRETELTAPENTANEKEIIETIIQKQKELEQLESKLEETSKQYEKALPWGDFSPELIDRLKQQNIHFQFYAISKKQYPEIVQEDWPLVLLSEQGNQVLLVLVKTGSSAFEIDAEEIKLPETPCSKLKEQITGLEKAIETIELDFDKFAANSIPKLKEYKAKLIDEIKFEAVIENTQKQADNKLMLLEGWVPKSKNLALNRFLDTSSVVYLSQRATPDDDIPVLLKNNRFSKLFEPIGSMFSLPNYAELDLTVFFAPFFMLFFGFCLGDAGYGLLFLIGAGIYKIKAAKEMKPYLTLIQFLGLATILFGAISGTLFGINLIETELPFTNNLRDLFLDPDKMFSLALFLGGVQILFGLFIKAANQAKQFGFRYALATLGWLTILIGSVAYFLLIHVKLIQPNTTILYMILGAGGFFVLFFSDPGVNVFARIGKGIWDIYSTVTGIFGDLLSYIRLFALGLSSAILGFVINDIGLQILGSSKILGPVFFAVFLILGHTLNILISSLGSFVHPMRLTFVEFYKNAGFKGGGKAYIPFKK